MRESERKKDGEREREIEERERSIEAQRSD